MRARYAALCHYGGTPPRCACCSESLYEFLAIDHIHGGGNEHKRQIGKRQIYHWLKKHGYPSGFRVLCHNCNQSLGTYGFCPHHGGSRFKLPPRYGEATDQKVLAAAVAMSQAGMYPSQPRLAKQLGMPSATVAQSSRRLRKDGKWPVSETEIATRDVNRSRRQAQP